MSLVSGCLGINSAGRLTIGGVDVTELAKEFETPLYIMDEGQIRQNCRAFSEAMAASYPGNWAVAYASKAFACKHMYRVIQEEDMLTDVASGGELFTALGGGLPPESIIFHGNNKTDEELRYAVKTGIRRVVANGTEELRRISRIAGESGRTVSVSLRLSPGIEPDTFSAVQTGQLDSKFGIPIETGDAMEAVRLALSLDGVELQGIHCHIGSQIFDTRPFTMTAEVMVSFMAKVRDELSFSLKELNLGGGYAVRYLPDQEVLSISDYVGAITKTVQDTAKRHGLPLPELVIEPGRAIVADAGITVYTVGSVKEILGVRTYLSVDGGMTDNPRYMLYGAEYDILLPARALESKTQTVTLAGRCCENELLGVDMPIQPVKAGDLLAVLNTGAYNYSMASNYNRVPRPPVVMVREGKPFLAVRRETWDDVARLDN
ncbi:MAG: diaminopimelate decarboxylase [Oscillospiraceae bacterium]|jgi:diaminopimelate decarboxylase|nr:diaminopimelate decarboxylase [Oscillospiraceae bacterium]